MVDSSCQSIIRRMKDGYAYMGEDFLFTLEHHRLRQKAEEFGCFDWWKNPSSHTTKNGDGV